MTAPVPVPTPPDDLAPTPGGTNVEPKMTDTVSLWRGDQDQTTTIVDGIAGEPTVPAPAEIDLPEIVPGWMRTRVGRRATARRTLARWWYGFRFHVARLPLYWSRLARRAPRGVVRLLVLWWRVTIDAEGRESIRAVRSGAVPDARGSLDRAEDEHWRRIKSRLVVDALGLCFGMVAMIVWLVVAPWWVNVVGAIVVLAVLGRLAAPEGAQPIVERVVYKGQAIERPSEKLVTRSLSNALAGVERALRDNPSALIWRQPPTVLETGAGYRMVVELPGAVTVDDAVKGVAKIAGGLSRDASCVAIEQVPPERGGHAAMAELTVLDAPMRATPPPIWPLADPDAGPIDIFHPIPLGVDLVGRTVAIDLMFRSSVVGAQPRVGKTFTVRVMVAAAALDPRTELHVFDCKGGVDFRSFGVGDEPGSGVIHSGASSLRPEVIAPVMEDTVRYLLADLRRRSDVINSLPVELCPEGKVTSELAADRALGLHPVFLFVDETQFINDWPNSETIWAGLTELAKAGPSYGICVLLASQQVNSDTIPRSVSTMAGLRFCLSVADTNEGNLVLGGGASKRGYRPDYLTLDDKGIGYLAGEGTAPRLMRTFLLDGPGAAKVASRARALREHAGLLTGHAAGHIPEPDDAPSVLDDLLAVWLPDASAVHLDTLAQLLADRSPDRYHAWDARTLGRAVRAAGCSTGPVSGVHLDGSRSSGAQGVKHRDLLAALANAEADTIDPDVATGPDLKVVE